jgi:hypothetical protein
MKISELIEVLQDTISDEGDLEIYTPVDHFDNQGEFDNGLMEIAEILEGDKKFISLTVYREGQEL